jgi:hypothetical protein
MVKGDFIKWNNHTTMREDGVKQGSTKYQEKELMFCSQCKSEIKQVDHFSKVSEGGNKNDLQNLQEDMEELKVLLKTAIHTSVKEVILYEINVILGKINSLTDACKRKIENYGCWTEVMRSANLFSNKNKQYQIPLINNRYYAFSHCKDSDSEMLKYQQTRVHSGLHKDKDKENKLKHKILIIGDSHTRGLATNLRHNLNEDYKVQGLIKPGFDLQ